MNRQRLEQLAREWRQMLTLRELLFALAAACGSIALSYWQPVFSHWQVFCLALLGTLLIRLAISRPWQLDAARLGQHLDRTYPQLEESSALFLRSPEQLTLLERLQLQRVREALTLQPSAEPRVGSPPRRLLDLAILCAAAALLAAFGSLAVHHAQRVAGSAQPGQLEAKRVVPPVPATTAFPKIVGNTFTITPPAYTNRPPRPVNGFTAEVEEGATVAWNVTLDRPVRDARLVAGASTFPLTSTPDGHPQGSLAVAEPTLFSLSASLPDGTPWNPPELFSIKVIKDQPPVVRLLQPALPRTEIDPPATAPVVVEAIISDDYAVADAHLVATVAKGSGEAVKFREQTIPFDTDTAAADSPLVRRFTKAVDLNALGMGPGDELYFFVEARDNRQPTANRTRSETRFLTLRGPDEKKITTGRGVAGVHLIPAYFRSERQLILDTEKLIAGRPTVPDAELRTRANDLGADQGFLRLRYGRFLGEDQEESALTDHLETNTDPLQARAPVPASGPRAAASIAQRFEQEHIEQDREGGGDDQAAPRLPPSGVPLTANQIRQPFVDSHDQGEKSTFFDHETKGTMRDALNAMWEAEGFLRTVRPEEALAPEHRALDILKDLQQSDRAYVQHVGFDAPPINVAQRRLRGETVGIPARTEVKNTLPPTDPAVASVRAALLSLTDTGTVPADALGKIEPALTAAATRQPDEFLPGLQALRRRRAGQADPVGEQPALQRALLRLLPPANPLPARADEPAPALVARYRQDLQPEEDAP